MIFGSARTLASDPLLKGFLDLMEENNWVMRLEPGADKIHHVIEAVVKTEEKEDGKTGKTVKREGKLGDRAVNGRPFLKEVLEVSLPSSTPRCLKERRPADRAERVKGVSRWMLNDHVTLVCWVLP